MSRESPGPCRSPNSPAPRSWQSFAAPVLPARRSGKRPRPAPARCHRGFSTTFSSMPRTMSRAIKRINVAVRQHDEPRFERGQNDVFQLVRKIGGVKKAQCGAAENVSLLRLFQFLADQRRAFQAHLRGGVTAAFQPFDQPAIWVERPEPSAPSTTINLPASFSSPPRGCRGRKIGASRTRHDDRCWTSAFTRASSKARVFRLLSAVAIAARSPGV